MRFEPFDHARFLGEAGRAAPRHALGGSAFVGGSWKQRGLPGPLPDDLDLGALNLLSPLDLRHALADHRGTDAERILPTSGVSGANLAVLLDRIEPGCNVVCERPYYHPLPAVAKGLGAHVRFVDRDPDDDWRLRPDAVADACDDDTVLVLLTSPNNPTGAVASAADLEALAAVAADHDAGVLADQIFGELTDHPIGADLHRRIVTTAGFNKTWGASALRVGWIQAAPDIVARLETVHQHAVLAASPVGERLAIDLLGCRALCRRQLEERLDATHRVFDDWVAATPGVSSRPASSLMAFPRLDGIDETAAFARGLLRKGINVVPGEFFGRAGHVRIGLGGDPDALAAGLAALAARLPGAPAPA